MISFSPLDSSVSAALAEGAVVTSVLCYCAAWCRSCGEYQKAFRQVSEQFPDALFLWVDIEEYETLLEDFDVQDFPTILIQNRGQNVFFGSVLPKAEVLSRLVRACIEQAPRVVPGPSPLLEMLKKGV